jgi:Leu/Phe-tRNA-protein transferase
MVLLPLTGRASMGMSKIKCDNSVITVQQQCNNSVTTVEQQWNNSGTTHTHTYTHTHGYAHTRAPLTGRSSMCMSKMKC